MCSSKFNQRCIQDCYSRQLFSECTCVDPNAGSEGDSKYGRPCSLLESNINPNFPSIILA